MKIGDVVRIKKTNQIATIRWFNISKNDQKVIMVDWFEGNHNCGNVIVTKEEIELVD